MVQGVGRSLDYNNQAKRKTAKIARKVPRRYSLMASKTLRNYKRRVILNNAVL